ncbi:MAG: DUF692 family protein [Anaerolineaceae bacterium]|nr:DUF692 family protein [Anaerolineaceae bacterium]
MKFAVNYSTPIAKMIEQGEVKVDLLKCPEWDGIVNAARKVAPAYIHFEISLGTHKVQGLNYDLIRRMLETTETPYLNTHLSNHRSRSTATEENRKITLKEWREDLEFLRGKLPDVKIIAENLPWHEFMPELEIACNPSLISEFIEENDLGLLLDLSHARISSEMMGMDYRDYIARLPVDRLAELHITGIREYNGYLTDHFEMQADDWAVAEWAKAQIDAGNWRRPEIVAFEYGGVGNVFCWRTEPEAIRSQVPRLYEIFGQG